MRVVALVLACSGCCLSVTQAETGGRGTGTAGAGAGANGGNGNGNSSNGGGNGGGETSGGSSTGTVGTGGSCLGIHPNDLDFGNTLINTSSRKSVLLVNYCNGPVLGIVSTVGGVDASLFAVDDAPATLAGNSQADVGISYSPVVLETLSVADIVFRGADGSTATVNLFGEPVSVALTLAPNPINFGYVPLDSTIVGCTTVTNQSNVEDVQITGITSFSTDGSAFALATIDDATPPNPLSFPITLQSGASAKVCFTFTPPVSQQYQGQLSLISNDPSGVSPIVQLTGWGGGPQITCVPTAIDFRGLDAGGPPTLTIPVTCTNTGTAIPGVDLSLDPPTAVPAVFSAQFDQNVNPYPLTGLAPGESAQIDVTYAPTAQSADDEGTLFVTSNGGQGKTLEIPLSGAGI